MQYRFAVNFVTLSSTRLLILSITLISLNPTILPLHIYCKLHGKELRKKNLSMYVFDIALLYSLGTEKFSHTRLSFETLNLWDIV